MNVEQKMGIGLIAGAILLTLLLIGIKINADREGAFLCSIVADSPTLTMTDCPAHNTSTSWYLLAAFGATLLVFAVGVYVLILSRTKKQKQISQKTALATLSDEEKMLYQLIKEHEGGLYQSDIIKKTELSKVQVSRILDKLEGKELIERKRRGMTNIVVLK